jgi:hypothetical protein
VMANYLRKPVRRCTYLVSSFCDQRVFQALDGYDIALWHCGGNHMSMEMWPPGSVLVGGGSTVGTRGMVMAVNFGFFHLHLFGFDTCLDGDRHHAYGFSTPEEDIGDIVRVRINSMEAKEYRMAGYMLGQLWDFKTFLKSFPHRVQIEVHGGGALAEIMRQEGSTCESPS